MKDKGFISIPRAVLESVAWRSLTSKQRDVFMFLLINANFKSNQWTYADEDYNLDPGQLITSLPSIKSGCAKDVSIQNIRTALITLESAGLITAKSTNKNRLVSITRWALYRPQKKNQQADQQINQQATNRQLTSIEQSKQGNKNNNNGTDVLKWKESILKNQAFIEQCCIANRISEELCFEAVNSFFTYKEGGMDQWANESACRSNFMNWLPMNIGRLIKSSEKFIHA